MHRSGPVSVDEVELASFIRDGYQAGKGQEAGKQQVRETLYREIKLNAELEDEASKVLKEQPKLAGALLRRLQTDGFDAINMAGLPLADIRDEPWSVAGHPHLKRRDRFQNIGQVSELVERAYYRIRIQQIRDEL